MGLHYIIKGGKRASQAKTDVWMPVGDALRWTGTMLITLAGTPIIKIKMF
jgi:hypothetical protein